MKKISISGKGGTGKSMLTTLLANVLSGKGYTVLTVDSDESNPGLYRMLGFDESPRPLMDLFGGEKQVIAEIKRRTTPDESKPQGEWLTREKFSLDDIPSIYILERDGLKLLTVGKITTAFEGCACPMAEVIKLFLEKLVLKDNEIALVDMEAGVEHFGRGVEKSLDTVLILVEPSFESVALAAKVNFLARGSRVDNIWAVLNKIPSQAIDEKLREELEKRGIKAIGTIYYDSQISEACLEGNPLGESQAREDVKKIVSSLFQGSK